MFMSNEWMGTIDYQNHSWWQVTNEVRIFAQTFHRHRSGCSEFDEVIFGFNLFDSIYYIWLAVSTLSVTEISLMKYKTKVFESYLNQDTKWHPSRGMLNINKTILSNRRRGTQKKREK